MRLVGWLMLVVCLAGAAACTGNAGCSGPSCVMHIDSGCGSTCTPDGGRFAIYVVDGTFFAAPGSGPTMLPDGGPAQSSVTGYETIPLFQAALAPNGNIGIAYVEFSTDQTDYKALPDPSLYNYDILYTEVSTSGAVTLPAERVTGVGSGTGSLPVQNFVGVSLDYYNGQPVVGFLGWAASAVTQDAGFDATQAYWYQHNAVVAYRNLNGGGTPGTWTQKTVESNPPPPNGFDEAATGTACGNDGSCSLGPITGLYPAVFVDGTETILAYRNVHFGSSTGTGDFDNSNSDVGYGGPISWEHFGLALGKPGIPFPLSPADPGASRGCPLTTAGDRTAYGDHSRFVHGDSNNAVLISDIGGNEYNSYGANVLFFERQNGVWNCPLSIVKDGDTVNALNLQETGPSIAYDAQGVGYAVVTSDISGSGAAYFKTCNPLSPTNPAAGGCTNISNWTTFETLTTGASGGYFSSVALNPDTHDPWVAYYYCSSSPAYNEFTCPAAERELQVQTSPGNTGIWNIQPVDLQGAWQTQMLYVSNPTRLVIAYRDPTTGAMKIAVENPP